MYDVRRSMRLSTAQAAAFLRTTERVVRQHITRGEIPATREGRNYKLDLKDLVRYDTNRERRRRVDAGTTRIPTEEQTCPVKCS